MSEPIISVDIGVGSYLSPQTVINVCPMQAQVFYDRLNHCPKPPIENIHINIVGENAQEPATLGECARGKEDASYPEISVYFSGHLAYADVLGELNDTVTHELVHAGQYWERNQANRPAKLGADVLARLFKIKPVNRLSILCLTGICTLLSDNRWLLAGFTGLVMPAQESSVAGGEGRITTAIAIAGLVHLSRFRTHRSNLIKSRRQSYHNRPTEVEARALSDPNARIITFSTLGPKTG